MAWDGHGDFGRVATAVWATDNQDKQAGLGAALGMKESLKSISEVLTHIDDLDFAVLIGSRTRDDAHPGSDWDIAIQWKKDSVPALEVLSRNERLRSELAQRLGCEPDDVDIIDLMRANLTMRAVVAEEGIPLAGENDLPWMRFLSRTWHDLEHWYLEQEYAV